MALRNEADFIKELIYDRKIFIRQIADMYHRRPATAAEIDALRQQAQEIVGDDAAVARLMAAVRQGNVSETAIDPSQPNDSAAKPEKATESKQPKGVEPIKPVENEEPKTKSAPEQPKAAPADDSTQYTGTVVSSFEMMQSNAAPGHAAPSKPINVSGQVIDDLTNKPLENFTLQVGQLHPVPGDLNRIVWGLAERPIQAGGRFSVLLNWGAGERIRVVANGYIPEPVLAEPPKRGATKVDGVVVRLNRGLRVSGRVVDYQGKPVAGASLFVIGDVPGANSSEPARLWSVRLSAGTGISQSSGGMKTSRS